MFSTCKLYILSVAAEIIELRIARQLDHVDAESARAIENAIYRRTPILKKTYEKVAPNKFLNIHFCAIGPLPNGLILVKNRMRADPISSPMSEMPITKKIVTNQESRITKLTSS